jgi:hypothetical protein
LELLEGGTASIFCILCGVLFLPLAPVTLKINIADLIE